MYFRRLILVPGVVLLGRLIAAADSPPERHKTHDPTPLATLKTVMESQFFTGFGFAIDSSAARDGMQAYRPPRTSSWRKRVAMRLRVTEAGEVTAISVGFQPSRPRGNLLVRMALADFVETVAPRVDSMQLVAFARQIRTNIRGAADTGFYYRDSADTLLPKRPSSTYLALLGLREAAVETFSASTLRVTRVIDGSDTLAVMTLAARDVRAEIGVLSDWVDTRRMDLLGGTLDDAATNDVVTTLDLRLARQTAREAVYDRKHDKGVLRLALDSSRRVARVTFAIPELSAMKDAVTSRGSMTSLLLMTVVGLVPHRDSVDAMLRAGAFLLNQKGPNAVPGARVLALLSRTRSVAQFDLEHSRVRMTRSGTGTHARVLIAVGALGSFAVEATHASNAATAGTRPRAGVTPRPDSDPGALYPIAQPPLTEQRVRKP